MVTADMLWQVSKVLLKWPWTRYKNNKYSRCQENTPLETLDLWRVEKERKKKKRKKETAFPQNDIA